jgi:hypothetical protein
MRVRAKIFIHILIFTLALIRIVESLYNSHQKI